MVPEPLLLFQLLNHLPPHPPASVMTRPRRRRRVGPRRQLSPCQCKIRSSCLSSSKKRMSSGTWRWWTTGGLDRRARYGRTRHSGWTILHNSSWDGLSHSETTTHALTRWRVGMVLLSSLIGRSRSLQSSDSWKPSSDTVLSSAIV